MTEASDSQTGISTAPPHGLCLLPLTAAQHRAMVRDFLRRTPDYTLMERGHLPDAATVASVFEDCLSGGEIGPALRLGLCAGDDLVALAVMEFGYPAPRDAYISLLLVDPDWRGLGGWLVAHLRAGAATRGAVAIHAAVLDINAAGRAFWDAQGFTRVHTSEPRPAGRRTQVYHRLRRPLA